MVQIKTLVCLSPKYKTILKWRGIFMIARLRFQPYYNRLNTFFCSSSTLKASCINFEALYSHDIHLQLLLLRMRKLKLLILFMTCLIRFNNKIKIQTRPNKNAITIYDRHRLLTNKKNYKRVRFLWVLSPS